MSDPIVGIDLGTTNSVVALCDAAGQPRVLADERGTKVHPSVVAFHPNGSVIVGVEAKQRRIIDPRNTVYSAKRLIGRPFRSREIAAAMQRMPYAIKEGGNQQAVIVTRGGEFAVPEISAIVLDHVRNLARGAIGQDVSRAVVTVPASFTDAQRSATATAGAIAGITVVRVLNEPTAAALAYGHQRQLARVIAVYDFGGGTFDITVLRLQDQVYEVLGTAGDSFLGGDDIDEVLMQHMAEQFLAQHRIDVRDNEIALMRLRAVAEQTKIELSRRSRAIVKVDEIAYGPGGASLNLETEITRDQLVARAQPTIERTFAVCEEAMRLAQLAPASIDDVVLVGGTTKIPYVRDRVTQFFGKPPRTDVNPEEAVAQGAALQGAALQRILSRKPSASGRLPSVPDTGVTSVGQTSPGTAPGFEEYATEERRTTAPMGAEVRPPAGAPIARITRPASAAPPPLPSQKRTMIGLAAEPPPPRAGAAADVGFDPFGPASQPTLTFGEPAPPAIGAPIPIPPPASQQPTLIGNLGDASFAPPPRGGPTVLDVTPRGLGIGTVAGYCEELIRRNSRVPTEMKKMFSTSRDGQDAVRIRVCQGESRRIDDNVILGDLVLEGLPPRPRGQTAIEVTFQIDASGILQVRARDANTGQEQRASLDLVGMQSPAEVDAARERFAGLRR